jgi:glycosyltransferase involved in cell wall biosynthesis
MMLWRDHADRELKLFDVVVTSGNEPQWWMPREDQTVLAYTHTTPRWMYDLNHHEQGMITRTVTQLKRWIFQQELATGIDLWVANSDIVARRISKYWGNENVKTVYPPIETEALGPEQADTEDFYLILCRLAPIKRVRQAVLAAKEREFTLKIAGSGPLRPELEAIAPDNVEFLGWVEPDRKRRLLAGARASINCCMAEDFGMSVVESMASGTPVITVDEGMPRYTVEDGTRGIHFSEGKLLRGIERFESEGVSMSERGLAEWTRDNFGTNRFIQQMRAAIDEAERKNRITPEFRSGDDTASEPNTAPND